MAKIIGNTTATPNPRPDWNQTDSTKADYIKNKPVVLTEEQVKGLIDEFGGDTQVQADFNQTDETKSDYIKNKPDIPTKTSDLTNDAGYLTSYTETDPTVPSWAKASTKPTYTKSEVGLGNVENVKQYSASNPPPYPVTSVNGKTGAVTITATDVAALPNTTKIPTKTSDLTNDSGYITEAPNEIYVGNGDMPEDATVQILTDGSDAETELKNELKEYINNNFGALTLDKHTDGLIYLFRNGSPVGNGISITGEVVEGDVFGYVDENNNIVLRGALANGTYTVKYEIEDEDGNVKIIEIGDMELDNNVYYSVTSNLTNCSISNSTKTVVAGGSYTATITANSGYALKSLTATMGGSAVTVTNGVISIASVTGNIVITAVAEEKAVTPSYTNYAKNFEVGRLKSDGKVDSTTAAATTCSDYIPFTKDTVVRVKGFGALTDYNCALYDSKGTSQSVSKANAATTMISYAYDSASGVVTLTSLHTAIATIRVSGILTGTTSDVIITVNEDIA
jgi:hypothetical protein